MTADRYHAGTLARLETQLAAQHAEIVALRAEIRAKRRFPRLPRRFLPLALVALLVVLTPLATFAASPFNDLTGGVHDANIQALYDAGITKGCVPNVSYCPTANVTREEMASFLARAAGLGGNTPVANAKTATSAFMLNGRTADEIIRTSRSTFGTGNPQALTGAYQPVATVTIDPVKGGFVVLNATVTFQAVGAQNTANFRLVDATNPFAGPVGYASTTTAVKYASGAATYTFGVEGPAAHTFVLEAVNLLGTSSASNAMITALFVPYGATGGFNLLP